MSQIKYLQGQIWCNLEPVELIDAPAGLERAACEDESVLAASGVLLPQVQPLQRVAGDRPNQREHVGLNPLSRDVPDVDVRRRREVRESGACSAASDAHLIHGEKRIEACRLRGKNFERLRHDALESRESGEPEMR